MPVVTSSDKMNRLETMRWGLVPSWSKEERVKFSTFNARDDKLMESSTWRRPFKSQRCIVPASGYYAWKHEHGSRRGSPYYFRSVVSPFLAFAGLYDVWHGKDGRTLSSYTIITTQPNELASSVHDRMPTILSKEQYATWLNKASSEEVLLSLLKPFPISEMEAYEVGEQISSELQHVPLPFTSENSK